MRHPLCGCRINATRVRPPLDPRLPDLEPDIVFAHEKENFPEAGILRDIQIDNDFCPILLHRRRNFRESLSLILLQFRLGESGHHHPFWSSLKARVVIARVLRVKFRNDLGAQCWVAQILQQLSVSSISRRHTAGESVRTGEELATIIYTSGTTGNPKGVMQSFSAMAWALSSGHERVSFRSNERMLSYLPLAHVAERILVEQGALRFGFHVFFAESLDTFVQDMQRARPTVFFSVPRLWVKFQQGVFKKMPPQKLNRLMGIPIIGGLVRRKLLKGLGLDQCRLAVGGAAPMPPDLLRWYRDLGLDLIEGYGMTENCAISHATMPGTFRPGTVGLPYAGVESRIDPNTGEIQMRCPAVMMGYFKDPEQTAATMTPDGWLRTGDKGAIDQDGCLRITGRVKDLFKTSKGKYVAPAPIEDLLVTHPDIEACAVTGANFAQPLGIVMLSPDAVARVSAPDQRAALTASLTEHLKAVNSRLEAHEQLDCIAVIATAWTPENGLVTPTFKVKRPRIEDLYASHYEAWLAQRKPVIWAAS